MSSNFSSKRTNKSKLSFLQQKDNKKLKTTVAEPATTTSESSTSKGKEKADDTIEVDGTAPPTSTSTTALIDLSLHTTQGLDASIHNPVKTSWADEMTNMEVDKTSLPSKIDTSSATLDEKITAAVKPRDESTSNTNQTATSLANKETLPEEETFIKVPKVTRFFATLSNVEIEGDTN